MQLVLVVQVSHFVHDAVQDSGVAPGSYMYSIYPKMCELILNSKSDNTIKSYFYAFKRWEQFTHVILKMYSEG
jgi:hypothetical protein